MAAAFFRSLVFSLDPGFAKANRVTYGCVTDHKLKAVEENRADDLRAQMVQFIKCNMASYHHLGVRFINADMPKHMRHSSVEERIKSMANPNAMVGMESTPTEKLLKSTIFIMDTNGNAINKFASTEALENTSFSLHFKSLIMMLAIMLVGQMM